MRHALADQGTWGGGLRGCNPFENSKVIKSDKAKQKTRNEKRKGKIEKVLNVCLICVCAHFYYVILYLYNLKKKFSSTAPFEKILDPRLDM